MVFELITGQVRALCAVATPRAPMLQWGLGQQGELLSSLPSLMVGSSASLPTPPSPQCMFNLAEVEPKQKDAEHVAQVGVAVH